MKVSVIITTLLVAQVSASFFDVFQGAVLSVQNSFGKLLSDVVTDVKETVGCTILAVEHVLSLSHDATTRYYHKCGSETNKTDSVSDARQDASLPKVEVTLNLPNNEEYLQKVIPAEIDARINETLSKVLGNFKPHNNVLSIENVTNESEQLAGVSVLVKKELEKLSNEVSKDLKKMQKQRDSEDSVDSILQEIKVLRKREQNSKNTSEANDIHQVLGKLDAIEATGATDNFKLEEILKDLESNSNNNLVGLRHELEEWKEEEARHLSEIKSKIDEHEKLTYHAGPYNRRESNHTQPVIFNTDINKDDVDTSENSQDISSYKTTQVKETFDSSTSKRTIGDTNHKSLLIANSSSSSQNYMFNELNDTVITSTSYSSIESPLESVIILPFKNPNDKQQSLAKPTFLPINEDNANETVIVSTTTLASTDTSSSDSRKEESPNLVANNNAAVTSAAQNTEAVLTSTTLELFKNENSKDSAETSTIASMMVVNPSVNASNSENESVSTLAHQESTKIMTPSIPTSLNVFSTATVNEEFSTVIANIVSDNDSNNTILPSSSKILESTSTENVLPEQTAVTFGGDHFTTELPMIMRINVSNDTLVISPSMPTVETTPVSETIQPEKTATGFGKENSLIFTTKIVDDNDSNDTIASTSMFLESAPLSKAIQTEETGTTANGESTEAITESTITSTTRNGGDSNTTLISTPISTISTSENETIQATLSTISTTSSVSKEFSTITTTIINSNYSNTPMKTDPSSMLDITPVSKTIEPEEPTKASGKRKSSVESNLTLKTTTTMESTPVSETIQPEENSTSAGNDESTEAITESTSTSVTDKDSETTITSTPTTIIKTSTSESGTIQAVDNTTLSTSEEEYFSSTANRLTETPNTADDDEDDDNDDDSSATVIMSTLETISESISEGKILAPEDEKRLPSTTSPPKTSLAALIDTNSNSDDIITSIPFPISEMTTVSEVTDLVESTTFTEDSILSTSPATVRDEVPIENNDPIITVTSKTKNTDSGVVTEIIQRVETTTAAEEQQELSSTSTQSAMIYMVTSTAFPPSESIPASKNVMASRNEEGLEKLPRLEAKTSRAPEALISPTPNLIVRSPPLTIAPPINREWLTPNKLNQQNYEYNTNGEQRNNYEFNGPVSLSDRLLQTRQPLINPEVPMYGQAATPPITRGLYNDAPKWLPPNRLIPDFPGQPPKLDNDALQKAGFDIFDSAHERFSDLDLPFGPEKDIFRTMPLIPNTPREPMGPPRMYYENPSYVLPSQHPIRRPFDSAPENTYRQLSLTTHRPAKTAAHANNYKNPSFDYDSFFHLRDPEAHQRALKEARHLMANSKRSDRIINNIMKNKNKFNARPIFG